MKERTFYKDKKAKLYNNSDTIQPRAYFVSNLSKVLIIMAAAILISVFSNNMNMDKSIIILLYLFGTIVVANSTDGFMFGVGTSVGFVIIFNLLFVEPYYDMKTKDSIYSVILFAMMVAYLLSSIMVSRLKMEADRRKVQARKMEMLYRTDRAFLKSRSKERVVEACGESLINILGKTILITIIDENKNLMDPRVYICNSNGSENLFKSINEREIIKECFRTGKAKGVGTKDSSNGSAHYEPINGTYSTLGVVGVACYKREILTEDEIKVLKIVVGQMAVALEREKTFEIRHLANIEGETEKIIERMRRVSGKDYATIDDYLYDNSSVNNPYANNPYINDANDTMKDDEII